MPEPGGAAPDGAAPDGVAPDGAAPDARCSHPHPGREGMLHGWFLVSSMVGSRVGSLLVSWLVLGQLLVGSWLFHGCFMVGS